MNKILNKNGNCYEQAILYVLAQDGFDDRELFVCHGIVGGFEMDGEYVIRHGHAWVEYRQDYPNPNLPADFQIWKCIDKSNGNDSELPRELYYKFGNIDPDEVIRYSKEDAMKIVLIEENYGPWWKHIFEVEEEEGIE